jgi:hypothetical protein
MHRTLALVVAIALAGCGGKKTEEGGGGGGGVATGSSAQQPPEPEKLACPPGNVVQDGKCVAVVTAEKIELVTRQQSRLDELAKQLEQVDQVATPVELLAAFRELPEWKDLVAKFSQLEMVDKVAGELDNGIKTLRTFRASLDEASTRLGNLKGELDRLMTDTGTARRLEEVRAQVSSQLRTALEPLSAQVTNTIENALIPLTTRLEEVGDIMKIACAGARLKGAGDQTKQFCKEADKAFAAGIEYLADFKDRPAKLYDEVTSTLEKELEALIDAESKKILDAAQARVNAALKLPAEQ